jgi:hypothetical protein
MAKMVDAVDLKSTDSCRPSSNLGGRTNTSFADCQHACCAISGECCKCCFRVPAGKVKSCPMNIRCAKR